MISIFNVFFFISTPSIFGTQFDMKLLLDCSGPKWFHSASADCPRDPQHGYLVLWLRLFVPSIFWVTNLRKRRVVHNSGHILSPWQGLTFHSSGPGIGWGGARVPLIHRSQPGWGLLAGPLSLLIHSNFFFFTFILLLSIARMLEPHVHLLSWASRLSFPLCPLFPTNACVRTHTQTRQFHTCADAGHRGPLAHLGLH